MFKRLVDLDQQLSSALYEAWAGFNIPEALTLGLAVYLIYLVPLLLLWLWFRMRREPAFLGGLAGLVGWLAIGNIVGSLYFRHRPFDRLDLAVEELFFHRPDKSFPSDHAIVSFAVAFLLFLEREYRLGAVFLIVGLVSGLARVGAGLHFLGDLIGAVPVALIAALAVWFAREFLTKTVLQKLERVLRPFRLA